MSQFRHDPTKRMNQAGKDRFTALNGPMFKKTPAQIEAWVETNVNNLPEAKDLMKKMCKTLVAVVKRVQQLEGN